MDRAPSSHPFQTWSALCAQQTRARWWPCRSGSTWPCRCVVVMRRAMRCDVMPGVACHRAACAPLRVWATGIFKPDGGLGAIMGMHASLQLTCRPNACRPLTETHPHTAPPNSSPKSQIHSSSRPPTPATAHPRPMLVRECMWRGRDALSRKQPLCIRLAAPCTETFWPAVRSFGTSQEMGTDRLLSHLGWWGDCSASLW